MSKFLDRLKAKMTGSFGGTRPLVRKRPAEKARQTIITNRFDQVVWAEARKSDPVDRLVSDLLIGDDFKGGARPAFDAAPELVKDLWMAFYKAAPRLEDPRFIDRDVYPARKILEELLENPAMTELQEITAGDPVMSTIAVDAMSEKIREVIGRIPPPPPPPEPKAPPAAKPEQPQRGGAGPGEDGQEQAEGDGQPGDGEPDPNAQGDAQGDGEGDQPGETDDFDPFAESDEAELAWQDEYDQAFEGLELDRALAKGIDAAAKEASDLDGTRRGIGLDDAEWEAMSPEQRLALAETLRTPEMRELAKIIGRMKRYALGIKATRIVDVPQQAYDVETGNSLPHVLKSEYALLATPETSYEFYRKYAQKELLQFKMRGEELAGKGPILICIDKSGSMSGGRFNWALAVAESLRRFAAEEDRDFRAIFFGTNSQRQHFDFPKGKGPIERVLAFLAVKANGGTQFDGVLTEALEVVSTAFDGAGKDKADIVFVTDGLAALDERWISPFNTERQRVGVRVFSVYIGGAGDMAGQTGPLGLLNKISDVTIPVSHLRPDEAKDIFARV